MSRLAEELSPSALVELVTTIAFENHRARWNVAFGIEALGFAEGAVCPLPERP
jgi:alkylhydroperoxidase family enzyme